MESKEIIAIADRISDKLIVIVKKQLEGTIVENDWKVKYDELEKENSALRKWKIEAVELLTKIHSYAHKHLEVKLGECSVDLVISMAKERDELKERGQKLADALEWLYTYGPGDATTIAFINKALDAWKGKEVENEGK